MIFKTLKKLAQFVFGKTMPCPCGGTIWESLGLDEFYVCDTCGKDFPKDVFKSKTLDEKLDEFMKQLAVLLKEQIEDGWPASFKFTEPQNFAERLALHIFISKLEKGIGESVSFTTEPGHA